MTRRRATTAVVMVMSLAAITAGAWGLSKWRPFEHDTSDIDWPANVQPLIDYIEEVTGLRFRDAIDFEFISQKDEYDDRVLGPAQEYSADARAAIATDEAVGRALGLWAGDTSLVDSFDTINSAAPRPVSWLPDENVMLINALNERAILQPYIRADLIVYLTQALAQQHFHLVERLRAAQTSQEYDATAAVYLGFALWVHDQYIDDLSASDHEDYDFESAAQNDEYVATVDSVPATFRAIRIAFQVLGPGFITALAEDDTALVLRALHEHIPVAMDQVSLPAAKYLRNDALESVAAPPGPARAAIRYSEQLGPFRLFLMFVTGLPANVALTASDGWGNDRFTAYELDGRVCLDVHLVADSPADADRMDAAMNRWAFARPSAADALVGRKGVNLFASVCDPGTDAEQPIATDDEIEQYFGRGALLRQQALDTGKPALAECVATEFYAQFTIDQISSASSDIDFDAELAGISQDCRNSV